MDQRFKLWLGDRFLARNTAWWPAALFLLIASFAAPAHAQYRTSIQGVVTDPQGAVIPGATLTLTDQATSATVVRTSNATGVFNFNALPADLFTLLAERPGFQKKVLTGLQLIPEQANALNLTRPWPRPWTPKPLKLVTPSAPMKSSTCPPLGAMYFS
jgi:hypothetical protein